MGRGVGVGMLLLLAAGCNVLQEAGRTLRHEPQSAWSEWVISLRLQRQARAAWERIRVRYSDCVPEFREGFLDGYVDYLDRGGPPVPPATPPSRYLRQPRYFTPEGHARLQQYFLGFQLGQQEAMASGQRQYLTVPVLLPPPPQDPPAFRLAQPPVPAAIPPADASPSAAPATESLPMPRPVPGEER